jgi:signal transduction histidine kinase
MDPLTVLATVQKQTVQMAHLLDDLLFLARISESTSIHGESTVDLDEIVLNEAHRLQRRSGDVAVHLGHLDAARIPGSARDLARLVANIGDNALHYAHTEVRIELFSTPPGAIAIVVTDDGPGIAVEDRERIFDRFTQLEDARSRSVPTPGVGLGLAIAQQIAARHDGTITVGERGDAISGTVMRVTLPPVVPG